MSAAALRAGAFRLPAEHGGMPFVCVQLGYREADYAGIFPRCEVEGAHFPARGSITFIGCLTPAARSILLKCSKIEAFI